MIRLILGFVAFVVLMPIVILSAFGHRNTEQLGFIYRDLIKSIMEGK